MKIYSCAFIAPSYNSDAYMIVVSFLFVLLLAFITTKLLMKTKFGHMKGKNIRIVERLMIANDKQLLIVEIQKKYYLLSSDKNNINLLDTLEGFSPLEVTDEQKIKFSEVLDRFKHTKENKNDK